jgi:hypothetical protein
MAERSPNFPSMSLGEAIDAIRLIYQREGRSKMPRLSAVKPLGYTSINGRSLSVLGALRAYDLIDGRGDDVRVSDDAVTILNAPQGPERNEALVRAFEAPAAFATLRAKGDASPDTLRWHLIKANFRDEAADKLLKVYLASRELVNAETGGYNGDASAEASAPEEKPAMHPVFDDMQEMAFGSDRLGAARRFVQHNGGLPGGDEQIGLGMGVHERVLQSGMLSKTASYRVIVSGPVGEAEIDRLLKKLEMDKEILADPDPEPQQHDL